MTRPGWAWLGACGLAAIAVAVWAGSYRPAQAPSDIAVSIAAENSPAKPRLALLTSLPILFGDRFGLDGGGSPLMELLGKPYQVQAISVADAASLRQVPLLLMAHPRAQPAEVLVELDRWVRDGGRLLLLADPRLDWQSDRPLGDKLRPPPDFADTGLLDHWGLTLSGPIADGPILLHVDGTDVTAVSPGRLFARGRDCVLFASGFGARCTIGRGKVAVIADADFLNISELERSGSPSDANLALVDRELARLAH